jgi:uncharacterized protein (TIGR03067 family)
MLRWALLIAAVGLTAAADAPKEGGSDLKKLEGTWKLVSGVNNGKELGDKTVKGARLVIEGDRHTVKVGRNTYKGTHKLNMSKSPKTIDISDTEGPFKGKTVLGIYELDGDEFKICYAPPGKPRPKDFTAKAGSGHRSHVWKRQKK